jgi:bacterioferritin
MSVDPRTLGWLSRALTHEMSAVQQYLAQSVLARLWGDEALAKHLRHEAIEEARLGRSVDDLLVADRVLEVDAVRLYDEALAHARRMRDADNAALLESILAEEVAHVRELDGMAAERKPNG